MNVIKSAHGAKLYVVDIKQFGPPKNIFDTSNVKIQNVVVREDASTDLASFPTLGRTLATVALTISRVYHVIAFCLLTTLVNTFAELHKLMAQQPPTGGPTI